MAQVDFADRSLVRFHLRRASARIAEGDTSLIPAGSTAEDCQYAISQTLASPSTCDDIAGLVRDQMGAAPPGGRNWAGFFQALGALLAQILPIIINLFPKPVGGGSPAPVTGGTDPGGNPPPFEPKSLYVTDECCETSGGDKMAMAISPAVLGLLMQFGSAIWPMIEAKLDNYFKHSS